MAAIHIPRTTLVHAILAVIHPAITHHTHFAFPVQLPEELHLLIRTHLRVHIARALLDSLHTSLAFSLSALCDDCKSYYAHVFGPHVADWPVVRAGRGCRCTAIGLPSRPPSPKTDDASDPPPRPPVGDREPPAYFLTHVQRTLATYASMDSSFPYADVSIASNSDLDALVSRVLSTSGWNAFPTISHRNWEFDDDVLIAPLSPSSAGEVPAIPLDALQIHLDLAVHDDILARSPLHPTKFTYFPPLPPPSVTAPPYSFSMSLASSIFLLVVASPFALTYALHFYTQ